MRRRSLFVFNKWITACVRANEIPDEEEEEEEEESFLWKRREREREEAC